MKTATDERILGDLTVALRRQLSLHSSILHRVAALVCLRLRSGYWAARTCFDESVRAVNQTYARPIIHAQHFAERQRVKHLFVRLEDFAQLVVGLLQFLLLFSQFGSLLIDGLAAASSFVELREAYVKRADDGKDDDREQNDLGAWIDLANQLASEFAQEDLSVIAPRGSRSFHCGLLAKGRD